MRRLKLLCIGLAQIVVAVALLSYYYHTTPPSAFEGSTVREDGTARAIEEQNEESTIGDAITWHIEELNEALTVKDGTTTTTKGRNKALTVKDGTRRAIEGRNKALTVKEDTTTRAIKGQDKALTVKDGTRKAIKGQNKALTVKEDATTRAIKGRNKALTVEDAITTTTKGRNKPLTVNEDATTRAIKRRNKALTIKDATTRAIKRRDKALTVKDGTTRAIEGRDKALTVKDGTTRAIKGRNKALTVKDGTRRAIKGRNKLARKFCEKHRPDKSLGEMLKFLKSNKLYVDDKHKFIYCHMPKVATTSWLKILIPLNNRTDQTSVHEESHQMTLANCTTKEAFYRVQNYFKFVFVRDPLERLVSAYKDKVISKRAQLKYASRRNISIAPVSFPEFVRTLLHSSVHRSFGMWNSISNVCQPCMMNYSFIGHFETLSRDADIVLGKLGLRKKTKFPPWKPSKTSSEVRHYYEQLSKEERKSVYEFLKNDYEIFGYSTDLYSDLDRGIVH